jgi:hypothetical protein
MENINFDTIVPCFGKVIVSAKDIYTDYLLNVLSPLLYEGFLNLYNQSVIYNEKAEKKEKKDKNFKNPGIIVIFQQLLCIFKDMNNTNIQDEATRIKNNSGCADFFDDLIKAVVKSHILVLTCNIKESKLTKENKFHESININLFIHKCYIESIKFLHETPELFLHTNTNDAKSKNNNSQHILQYIKLGIKDAIKNTLPMRQILEEFLHNNYEEVYENHIQKVKNIISDSIKIEHKQLNLLEETDENKKIDMDRYDFDLEDFIIGRKKDDTVDYIDNHKEKKNESLLLSAIISDKNKKSDFVENKENTIDKKSDKKEMSEKKSDKLSEKKSLETPPKQMDLNDFFSNKKKIGKYEDNIMLDAIQKKSNDDNKDKSKEEENKKDIDIETNGLEIVRKSKDKESENRFYETNE